MKKHNNKFFIIIVPICIILILAMIFYDRYQTSQLAKKYNDTNNQTTQVSSNNDLATIYCVGDSLTLGTSDVTSYPGYLKENLNFMLLGDYTNQRIKIYNESNALSLDQINAIGIDPSDCELIYDRSAVPPKPAIFNRDMIGISHGIFFACITVEALSESILFKGFGHPDVSEKKHFSFKQVPPVFNSKYINLYIGQWKLDRHGRNIYELDPKPKVTSNMKDNKELKETFEHILSTGDGEIIIKISGVDNDEKSV